MRRLAHAAALGAALAAAAILLHLGHGAAGPQPGPRLGLGPAYLSATVDGALEIVAGDKTVTIDDPVLPESFKALMVLLASQYCNATATPSTVGFTASITCQPTGVSYTPVPSVDNPHPEPQTELLIDYYLTYGGKIFYPAPVLSVETSGEDTPTMYLLPDSVSYSLGENHLVFKASWSFPSPGGAITSLRIIAGGVTMTKPDALPSIAPWGTEIVLAGTARPAYGALPLSEAAIDPPLEVPPGETVAVSYTVVVYFGNTTWNLWYPYLAAILGAYGRTPTPPPPARTLNGTALPPEVFNRSGRLYVFANTSYGLYPVQYNVTVTVEPTKPPAGCLDLQIDVNDTYWAPMRTYGLVIASSPGGYGKTPPPPPEEGTEVTKAVLPIISAVMPLAEYGVDPNTTVMLGYVPLRGDQAWGVEAEIHLRLCSG